MEEKSMKAPGKRNIRNAIVLAVLLALILPRLTDILANFIIDYNWWKEVGQVSTWISMLWYSIAPFTAGDLVGFSALWIGLSRGVYFSCVCRQDFCLYF